MKTMTSKIFVGFVGIPFLWINVAVAETFRIPVSRDLWVSSADGETEGNKGKASQLKLKGYQEFSILDFDLSKIVAVHGFSSNLARNWSFVNRRKRVEFRPWMPKINE